MVVNDALTPRQQRNLQQAWSVPVLDRTEVILQIFARTVLNQSGRAVEVMTLVLGVFLAINLTVSAAMNRWDRRLRAQGR